MKEKKKGDMKEKKRGDMTGKKKGDKRGMKQLKEIRKPLSNSPSWILVLS